MPAREAFADDGGGGYEVGEAFVAAEMRGRGAGEERGGLWWGGGGTAVDAAGGGGRCGGGAAPTEGQGGEEVEGKGGGWRGRHDWNEGGVENEDGGVRLMEI